jgi:hypothetical protein
MSFNKLTFCTRLTGLIFLPACLSFPLQAAEIDAKTLVASCAELVVIYDKSEEKSLYASVTTSVAEAMRAGICRGMIEEHERHEGYRGCSNGWREQALIVAKHNLKKSRYNIEDLLNEACDG